MFSKVLISVENKKNTGKCFELSNISGHTSVKVIFYMTVKKSIFYHSMYMFCGSNDSVRDSAKGSHVFERFHYKKKNHAYHHHFGTTPNLRKILF